MRFYIQTKKGRPVELPFFCCLSCSRLLAGGDQCVVVCLDGFVEVGVGVYVTGGIVVHDRAFSLADRIPFLV